MLIYYLESDAITELYGFMLFLSQPERRKIYHDIMINIYEQERNDPHVPEEDKLTLEDIECELRHEEWVDNSIEWVFRKADEVLRRKLKRDLKHMLISIMPMERFGTMSKSSK